MWLLKDDFFYDDDFPFFNFVTTRGLGDMKDPSARSKACSLKNIDGSSVVYAEQVHGNYAALAGLNDGGKFVKKADGLLTAESNVSVAVFTADCLPVMIGAKGTAAGIVHAGWRGLFNGILPEAIRLIKKEFGVPAGGLTASIGPHICRACYGIGEEIRQAFGLPASDVNFDLAREAVSQLKKAGVEHINVNDRCTMHETEMFFSYRKDKTPARIMSLVRFLKITWYPHFCVDTIPHWKVWYRQCGIGAGREWGRR